MPLIVPTVGDHAGQRTVEPLVGSKPGSLVHHDIGVRRLKRHEADGKLVILKGFILYVTQVMRSWHNPDEGQNILVAWE